MRPLSRCWAAWTLLALVALALPASASNITTVHVVFGSHLDVGFDGIDPEIGTDDNVLNVYFQHHLPKALAVAKALRQEGGQDRFIYTSHVRTWVLQTALLA